VFRPDAAAIDGLSEFREQRRGDAARHQIPRQDLRGGLHPCCGIRGGDGACLPEQRLSRGTGPILRHSECFDLPGLVDLGGVDGSGQHFQLPPEVQLLVRQQFPERTITNIADRRQRRFDQRVRLVEIGEPGAVHRKDTTQHHRQPLKTADSGASQVTNG
jgi:hypothetical protein